MIGMGDVVMAGEVGDQELLEPIGGAGDDVIGAAVV